MCSKCSYYNHLQVFHYIEINRQVFEDILTDSCIISSPVFMRSQTWKSKGVKSGLLAGHNNNPKNDLTSPGRFYCSVLAFVILSYAYLIMAHEETGVYRA